MAADLQRIARHFVVETVSGRAAERAYVALGSNLGDRAGHLRGGARGPGRVARHGLVARSAIEETAPLGGMGSRRT